MYPFDAGDQLLPPSTDFQSPANSVPEQERFFAWENFVSDVQAAHAELLRHNEIKPYATAFLGHSEGALLSLAATAAMGKRAPYALVLASAPGLPLRQIVRGQIGRNGPTLLPGAERVMGAILQTGHVPTDAPPELRLIFPPYAGPFFKSALTFDPAKVAAGIDTACLMLHGGADAQIVPLGDIQPLIDALAARGKPGEALTVDGYVSVRSQGVARLHQSVRPFRADEKAQVT